LFLDILAFLRKSSSSNSSWVTYIKFKDFCKAKIPIDMFKFFDAVIIIDIQQFFIFIMFVYCHTVRKLKIGGHINEN